MPKRSQEATKQKLRDVAYAPTLQQAERRRRTFQAWARGEGLQRAADLIEEDWERMVSYYRYPRAHWRHLRTTNVIESPFAALRLRTDAEKRFKKVTNATAVIWKMLLAAETKFRKLNAPELLQDVWRELNTETEFESTIIRSGTLPDSFTHLLTGPQYKAQDFDRTD